MKLKIMKLINMESIYDILKLKFKFKIISIIWSHDGMWSRYIILFYTHTYICVCMCENKNYRETLKTTDMLKW